MAGHSHWKQIKERKGKADERRGAEFSKLLRAVTVQAKQEKNPDFNPGLRAAVERARTGGVPRENIERAIEKAASGEGTTEEIILEAYGPGGTALVIQALTDNKNRTIQEIKNILKDGGGR
ncbi:MAG: transcriptional regulator, partial [Candidatus Jorgensenbacteria bacterium GW2011_GWC1_48_8]